MEILHPDSVALVSRPEFARLARASRKTFNHWLGRGLLPKPVIHDGNIIRWRASDVAAFLRGGDHRGVA
jgi:predicted DNA-binding transcriptional regulator AlpA